MIRVYNHDHFAYSHLANLASSVCLRHDTSVQS